jgi:hypothetical protein
MKLLTAEDHVLDGDIERAEDSSKDTAGETEECEQDEEKGKSGAVDDDAEAVSSKTPTHIAVALITQRTSTATLLFNLAGSVCFIAGSIGFIWSTWTSEWLRPFQYGSNLWVMGSILFLIPMLALLRTRFYARNGELCSYASSCSSRAELCMFGCLLCFLVGCALGATGWSEESVVQHLPAINALFLVGSALPLVDSLLVAWSHQRCISFKKLACCHDDDDDGDGDDKNSAPPFPFIGLVVAGSYVFASALGGYGLLQGVVQAGMFGWAVGAIVSLLETIPELYERHTGSSN